MKYNSINLNEPGVNLPLRFAVKLNIEYRPNGVFEDCVPTICSNDPEGAADQVVHEKGWDKLPNFDPKDVWVNFAL